MGATYPDGNIKLNSYWFSRDSSYLKSAAEHNAVIEIDGIPIGWHGPMVWEPQQLLTHEFGHIVWYSLPEDEVAKWAKDRWTKATKKPYTAPSGYALDNAVEFFGEMFALVHLGFATDDEVLDLHDLIERLE